MLQIHRQHCTFTSTGGSPGKSDWSLGQPAMTYQLMTNWGSSPGSSGQPGSSSGPSGLAEQPARQQPRRTSGGSPPWPVLPPRRPQHTAPSQCRARSAHKLDCLRTSIWCPLRSETAYGVQYASCAERMLALQVLCLFAAQLQRF